jgi:hypothetical protein
MGRAKELRDHLKERLGPVRATTPVAASAVPSAPVEQSDDKPQNPTIPDDTTRDSAPFAGNAGATGTVAATENRTIPDDNPRISDPPRRRGRPTREEVAARQTPQESEEEARRQAENVVEQAKFEL